MADENPEVSGQTGEPELPTPSFSETGGSPTSTGADEIVSKLTPILEQIVERKVQSVKDKRFSEIEKALGARQRVLAELESDGVSIPKEVRTQMQLRELEERLAQATGQPASPNVDGSTSQKAAVTEAITELKEHGLATDDPDFIEILRGRYASRAEFDLKVQKYINRKLRPTKPANPADVVQSPAARGASTVDVEKLTARLMELSKQPSKYAKEIAEIGDQLKKAG